MASFLLDGQIPSQSLLMELAGGGGSGKTNLMYPEFRNLSLDSIALWNYY